MSSGKSDPRYGEALSALERASGSLSALSAGLAGTAPNARSAAELAASAATQDAFLVSALGELRHRRHEAPGRSGQAPRRQRQACGRHRRALRRRRAAHLGADAGCATGAGQLQAGLGQLTSGAGQLESGLAGGVSPTGQLVNGLGVMQSSVAKFRGSLPSPKGLEELQQKSPGLFNSGYFLLAAIAGAPAASANAAGFAVNVTRGGNAAQIVVVSRHGLSSAQTAALGTRLRLLARRFAARNHLQVAVGGPAGNLIDLASATRARLPWVIAAIALAVALALGLALRAVLVPLVAVLIDLLTVAAAFGTLTLLFGGSHPPLGGPGYVDPMSIIGIFTAIFGISLVFLVVLLVEHARRAAGRQFGRRRAGHRVAAHRRGDHRGGSADDRRRDPLRHDEPADGARVRGGLRRRRRPGRVPRAARAAAGGRRGARQQRLVAGASDALELRMPSQQTAPMPAPGARASFNTGLADRAS